MTRPRVCGIAFGMALSAAPIAFAEEPFALLWDEQTGVIDKNDRGYGVTVGPGGFAYDTGETPGVRNLPNTNETDYFLRKISPSGSVIWSKTLGSAGYEQGKSVTSDTLGNLFVAGTTTDGVASQNTQFENAFLTKFDPDGGVLWSRQIDSGTRDYGEGVAVDALGNAYLTGYTGGDLDGPNPGNWGAFLTKFDPSGVEQWTRHVGTPAADLSFGVAVDAAGNAFIAGRTQGDLAAVNPGSSDLFLSKIDPGGQVLWSTQWGTSADDQGLGVTVGPTGDAFVAGYSRGSLGGPSGGSLDGIVTKVNTDGVVQWTTQVGVSGSDLYHAITHDTQGNLYATGKVTGNLGPSRFGIGEVLVTKMDPDGNVLWHQQFGSQYIDNGYGIAVDDLGHLYVTGETSAPAQGAPLSRFDAILAKLVFPGDTDGDGDIDDADLGTQFANYTGPFIFEPGPKTGAQGDVNGDGDVDDADLGTAFAGYTGPLSPASTVPEPAGSAWLVCAGWLTLGRRRDATTAGPG
ncbi:MAG: SBBP repeat-containing protein [Phycisphaeraceae bacterium]